MKLKGALILLLVFIYSFVFSQNRKSIYVSSKAIINSETRLEDIKKLFDEINVKIESVKLEMAAKQEFIYLSYFSPKFNVVINNQINKTELEIIVELGSDKEPFTFDNNGGIMQTLLFRPILFTDFNNIDKTYERVKKENIQRLKGIAGLKQIQEDPPVFKVLESENKEYETFSVPQTESIILTSLFQKESVSKVKNDILVYNVGLLLLKPNYQHEIWKNAVKKQEANKREEIKPKKRNCSLLGCVNSVEGEGYPLTYNMLGKTYNGIYCSISCRDQVRSSVANANSQNRLLVNSQNSNELNRQPTNYFTDISRGRKIGYLKGKYIYSIDDRIKGMIENDVIYNSESNTIGRKVAVIKGDLLYRLNGGSVGSVIALVKNGIVKRIDNGTERGVVGSYEGSDLNGFACAASLLLY